MQIKNLLNIKILTIFIFVIIFLIGINSFQDYGIYTDDPWRRDNDLFWYEYIKRVILNPSLFFTNNLEVLLDENIYSNEFKTINVSTNPSLQGSPLGILCETFIDLFKLNTSRDIYQFRHLSNFIIFFIALCLFSKLIYKRYNSYIYSLIGVLFLFLTPRIFGESFYNSQDISFLTLTMANIYTGINFIKKPNFKHTLTFSLFSALLFDTRILAILPISIALTFFFLKCLRSNLFLKSNFKFVIYYFIFTFFFIIIFWPYLWSNPFGNLLFAITELSSVATEVTDLYLGEFILSSKVPSHYYLVWILITSPLIVVLLFLLGTFFLVKRAFGRFSKLNDDLNDMWRGDKEMCDIYFFMIILLSILLLVIKGLGYNGWRHLYYIYPSIIITSLYGLYIFNLIVKKNFLKLTAFFLITLNLLYISYWNYKNHPYQHVYFNLMFKNYFHNNFELDYWGLSNRSSIEHIISNVDYTAKIATKSFASLEKALLIFNEEDKNKISIIHDLKEADFIITNYIPKRSKDFIIDKEKYEKYYEILVDKKPINTVYKKVK